MCAYRDKKIPLVGHKDYVFDGCTSTAHNGFDGTVVPTLVDLDDGVTVYVDSNMIV